ncbi:MAG: PD40 domain-containing protein, partial [Verrucomicrobia bacterium]|nr:PD40 domain-containing protein [Verrucomicrobiota bacterium]
EPISRTHESQVDILHIGRNDQAGYFYYVMELADDAGGVNSDQLSVARRRLSVVGDQLSVVSGQLSVVSGQSSVIGGQTATHAPNAGDRSLKTDHCLLNTYSPKTLRNELQKRGRLPLEECLEIALSLTTALEHLHKHGLVHRDVKPSNIIFVDGRPKLADIGLVADVGKTLSFVGTEGYLPPEGPGSPQADIYSLGKVLYEICTGKDRLEFPELPTNLEAIQEETALLEFNEVLVKACQADARKRYQSSGEMRADLQFLQTGKSVVRLRTLERRLQLATKIGVFAVVAAIVSVLALIQWRRAKNEATRAEQREHAARQTAYAAEMLLAQQALDESNLGRATELVRKYFPRPGEKDLRDWEWRWRWKQCQSDELDTLGRYSNGVNSVAFSPDHRWLASGDQKGTVKLWDANSRRLIAEWALPHAIHDLAFSPNANLLAILGGDAVKVYDTDLLPDSSPFLHLTNAGDSQAFSPDSKTLAVPDPDGELRLWDLRTKPGTAQYSVSGLSQLGFLGVFRDGRRLRQVAFSPDGRTVALSPIRGADDTVLLWDIVSKSEVGRLTGQLGVFSGRLVFSPDGKLLIGCGGSWAQSKQPRRVWVWDVAIRREVTNFTAHAAWVSEIAFSPDGTMVATASGDQTIKLWDTVNWHEIATLKGHRDEVQTVAFSPDGSLLASGSKDGELKIWSLTAKRQDTSVLRLPKNGFNFQGSPWAPEEAFFTFGSMLSPDGGYVVRLHIDEKELSVWSLAEPKQRAELQTTDFRRISAGISPQGRLLAVSAGDCSIKLFRTDNMQLLTNLVGHTALVSRLVFSHGGGRLASDDQASIKVWDLLEMEEVASFPSQRFVYRSRMTFAPDDSVLVAGYADGTVSVLDLKTKQQRAHFKAHRSNVSAVAVSPDGKKLATGSMDATAKLWDMATLQPTAELVRALQAYTDATFSPDGRRVIFYAGGSEMKSLKIFDSASGLLVATLPHPSEQLVGTVSFLPDGETLVSTTADAIVTRRAPSLAEIEAAEKARSPAESH